MRLEFVDPLRGQVGPGLEIVIVILGDRQELAPVGLEAPDRRGDVVSGERGVLPPEPNASKRKREDWVRTDWEALISA